MLLLWLAAALGLAAGYSVPPKTNNRPAVGVLTSPTYGNYTLYAEEMVPSSHLKFLEAAGARMIYVPYNASEQDLHSLFLQTNGMTFSSGRVGDPLRVPLYTRAVCLFYKWAVQAAESGDFYPLWGVCSGHELLMYCASNQSSDVLSLGALRNVSVPLNFTAEAAASRLVRELGPSWRHAMATSPYAQNWHAWAVMLNSFKANPLLSKNFMVVSTNVDTSGGVFVSTTESRIAPIFTTQWHPERPRFESQVFEQITLTEEGQTSNAAFAWFFVGEARRSTRRFVDPCIGFYQQTFANWRTEYVAWIDGTYLYCNFPGVVGYHCP
eukprot:TRINITY_DN9239_c0_g1_i1.p1 TRINITY_DN9239_c0_g1~~TRINITY_DN9239_c0_g1_i1.p1  ORF type:complete len:324 (+),score=64.80 TRINITY_DN9239_c0_g1_i1:45-1016(+)